MTVVYSIAARQRTVDVDQTGHAEVPFVVTNITTSPVRTRLQPAAMDGMPPDWLKLLGLPERDLAPDTPTDVTVIADVPLGSPGGSYRLRLDAISVPRPDDDSLQGPPVVMIVQGEKPVEKQKRSLSPLLLLIPIALLLLLIGGGVALFLATRPVVVPDVAGLPAATARQTLEATCAGSSCLTVTEATEFSAEPAGLALRTDPPAGSEVSRGSDVRLIVSVTQEVQLPDVIGFLRDDAIDALTRLCEPAPCLDVKVREVVGRGIDGTVTEMEPPPFTVVPRGEIVLLIVSCPVLRGCP